MDPITAPNQPVLIPLSRCADARAGGKARQLARLIELGLRVPDGFVVLGATRGSLPEELDAAYEALGGAVAVRSSALHEDGADASFAGQYDTFLNIEGAAAVRTAVERCLDSAQSKRAAAYRGELRTHADAETATAHTGDIMSVVVQKMVQAKAAGVLFTVDPVSGARDQLIIEATRGLGEALVSGHVTADRFVIARDGRLLSQELARKDGEASIDAGAISQLVRDSLHAESAFGHPLDLEWAVDETGTVHFLQARPITTMELPGLDELDTKIDLSAPQMYTTYNVSEVLPGASTPLGWSIVGVALDDAMRELFISFGTPRARLSAIPLVATFSGHLFINMRGMYEMAGHVAGASKENADYSLAGHVLPDLPLPPPASPLQRAKNGVSYFLRLRQARPTLEAFVQRTERYAIPHETEPSALYRHLTAAKRDLYDALYTHMLASSLSGVLHGVLLGILSEGKPASAEHHAATSTLLSCISPSGTGAASTSLMLPQAIEKLTATIAADPEAVAQLRALKVDAALAWLRKDAPPAIQKAFAEFLRDHGHRCVREVELRQADWEEDPRPLVASLQRAVATPRKSGAPRKNEAEAFLQAMPAIKRRLLLWLSAQSRDAVVLRERSKSHAVRILRKLRGAYLRLAALLVTAGRIPDADLIFFVTHDELSELAKDKSPGLVRKALHRRRLHAQKMALEFPRVSLGKPQPIDPGSGAALSDEHAAGRMRGTPVSRGVITGRARVARTLEEADAIEPGEILVVPYTDVGWAPYFVRAAGLATEIGGTLSHGAVVAREYGLPAVVNLPGATRLYKTGELLRLDGTTGEVRRLPEPA